MARSTTRPGPAAAGERNADGPPPAEPGTATAAGALRIAAQIPEPAPHRPRPRRAAAASGGAGLAAAATSGWALGRGDPRRVRAPRRLALRVPVRGRRLLLEQPSDAPARPWPAAAAAAIPPPDALARAGGGREPRRQARARHRLQLRFLVDPVRASRGTRGGGLRRTSRARRAGEAGPLDRRTRARRFPRARLLGHAPGGARGPVRRGPEPRHPLPPPESDRGPRADARHGARVDPPRHGGLRREG